MTAAEPLPPTLSTCPVPEDNDDLRDAITTLAGHINAAEYRFIKLLAALIERKAWLGDAGFKTPAHWLMRPGNSSGTTMKTACWCSRAGSPRKTERYS